MCSMMSPFLMSEPLIFPLRLGQLLAVHLQRTCRAWVIAAGRSMGHIPSAVEAANIASNTVSGLLGC
jgi:hypothetical protein